MQQEKLEKVENEYRMGLRAIESFKGISGERIQSLMKRGYTREEARELCIANDMVEEKDKIAALEIRIQKNLKEILTENDVDMSYEYVRKVGEKMLKEVQERQEKARK
jgi:sporulation protein YlmC with PRC-barrel domain